VEARVRPYALEREERTKVISAEGRRGVDAASMSAWRLDPGKWVSREVTRPRNEKGSWGKISVDNRHTVKRRNRGSKR
jgi:hypothetical protein